MTEHERMMAMIKRDMEQLRREMEERPDPGYEFNREVSSRIEDLRRRMEAERCSS